MTLNRTEVIGAVVLILQLGCGYAFAETPPTLAELVNLARLVCLQPSNSGGLESAQFAAEASGSLPKFLGPVIGARIGASLNGQVQRYDGPLQKDQASDRASYRTCVEFFFDRASGRYGLNLAKITFRPLSVRPRSNRNTATAGPPKQTGTPLSDKTQPSASSTSANEANNEMGACAGKKGIIITNSSIDGAAVAYSLTENTNLCADKVTYNNVNKIVETH